MGDINDFYNKIKNLKVLIARQRPKIALLVAFDLSANIKLRIQDKGENSNNTSFAPYTKPYAKTRQKEGYQVSQVDFTKTGALMNNIQPQVVSSDDTTTLVNIGARSLDKQQRLRGFVKKRGNIILPSKQEIAVAVAQYGQFNVNLVKTNL